MMSAPKLPRSSNWRQCCRPGQLNYIVGHASTKLPKNCQRGSSTTSNEGHQRHQTRYPTTLNEGHQWHQRYQKRYLTADKKWAFWASGLTGGWPFVEIREFQQIKITKAAGDGVGRVMAISGKNLKYSVPTPQVVSALCAHCPLDFLNLLSFQFWLLLVICRQIYGGFT